MIEAGLRRATAVSFLVHVVLISLLFVTIRKSPTFVVPSPYTVRLVSPDRASLKAMRVPPKKTFTGMVEDAPAPEAARKAERTAKAKPKAPPADLKDYAAERKKALIARKKEEQYLADRKRALEAKRKLRRVKALGSEKARVKVTATLPPGGAGAPGGKASIIVGDYISRVAALIQQEWVFLDTGAGDISATISVRVLKNGSLIAVRVEKPSGNSRFDQAAIKAINRASPVEPPPYEMELGLRFCPGELC